MNQGFQTCTSHSSNSRRVRGTMRLLTIPIIIIHDYSYTVHTVVTPEYMHSFLSHFYPDSGIVPRLSIPDSTAGCS